MFLECRSDTSYLNLKEWTPLNSSSTDSPQFSPSETQASTHLLHGSGTGRGSARHCPNPHRIPRRSACTGLCCPTWVCLQPHPPPAVPAHHGSGSCPSDLGSAASASWFPGLPGVGICGGISDGVDSRELWEFRAVWVDAVSICSELWHRPTRPVSHGVSWRWGKCPVSWMWKKGLWLRLCAWQ